MNILVLGGTRFVGKRLVNLLIHEGHEVTVASRWRMETEFSGSVEKLQLDRQNRESMEAALEGKEWDVVYDQICYSPEDALLAVELLTGKTKRYIEISSMSVYEQGGGRLTEDVWSPAHYPLTGGGLEQLGYAEAKRRAEAVFWNQREFEAVMVRFPIILGLDDYTRRLHWHVSRVLQGEAIGVPAPEALISFIHSAEAAMFLSWLKDSKLVGPVNACSLGEIAVGDIISMIESASGKRADIHAAAAEEQCSPFGIEQSWYMDCRKAIEAGFQFERLEEWLPGLVKQLVQAESEKGIMN